MMTTEGQEENGLPPAGLADLDPSLGEQTKGQAKSGLKDNNTIQKVSMRHSTNGLVPSTVAKPLLFRGRFVLHTEHSFSICPRSVCETPIYNVSSLRDLEQTRPLSPRVHLLSFQQEGYKQNLVTCPHLHL